MTTYIKGQNQANSNASVKEWLISDLLESSDSGITILGNPKVTDSPYGKAVVFNGNDDAIILEHNPLSGLKQFTIEIIMFPDGDGPHEQRFLHFGGASTDRVLMETRVKANKQWYFDAYIKSGESQLALIDTTKLHPTDKWCHAAFVIDNGYLQTFIDGEKELEGNIEMNPIVGGQTSIGVRLNKVYWFKGTMYKLKISPAVLLEKNFLKL